MVRRRRLHSAYAIATLVWIGSIVGMLLPTATAQVVGIDIRRPSPEVELQAAAQALAPYEIKQVRSLPAGAYLFEVSWMPPGAETPGSKSFSVDLVYMLPDGSTIHLWQTNQSLAGTGKDPTTQGTLVSAAGKSWRRTSFADGAITRQGLSRRFEDGITVAVYGSDNNESMQATAASVE